MLNKGLKCDLPCTDVNRDFIYPQINLDPNKIELIMISEAPPAVHSDYYYKNKKGNRVKDKTIQLHFVFLFS